MKRFQILSILLTFVVTSACQSHQTDIHKSAQNTRATTLAAVSIPKNFSEYASERLGNGTQCVVGATTDTDGMNQKPVVYIANATGKHLVWVAELTLPPDTYQSRATHCTSSGGVLFVLQQSDTQSEQTLSQTLLHVAKMDMATGSVQIQRDIQIPGAFSAWVAEGPSHFQWSGNSLVVSGNERAQLSPDKETTFVLHLNADLEPISGDQP